jgi:lipopolysaccharide transport system ATP-binding protein
MSSDDVVIDVRQLSKRYEIYAAPRDRLKQIVFPRIHRARDRVVAGMTGRPRNPAPDHFREFWALHDVTFEVRRGETFGIIGRNGSGKSTLLQMIAGVLGATSGSVSTNGRVAALLELGSGFDHELTGRENVFLSGQILGLGQREIEQRYERIAEFADIGEFIEEPVKTYSSGMFLRLAFAVQAHIDASIVIIDEALAVGDVFFRQKCYARLEQLKGQGAAILIVSHSMPDIEQHCERALLLDRGRCAFLGPSSEAAKRYYLLHQGSASAAAVTRRDLAEPAVASATSSEERPPADAFLDLTRVAQVTNGQARCVGVALCDENAQAASSFQQGDAMQVYCEFEPDDAIGIAICGIVIKNDRGVIVHGKNSWQLADAVALSPVPGQRLICWQRVVLALAPGDYVFEVGLAAVTPDLWAMRHRISHEAMSAAYVNVCQLANVGVFSVGLRMRDGIATLTHHGIADLGGSIRMSLDSMTNRASRKHQVS